MYTGPVKNLSINCRQQRRNNNKKKYCEITIANGVKLLEEKKLLTK